jgi:hypothetical protein
MMARAIAMRCRWPPLSAAPRSAAKVSQGAKTRGTHASNCGTISVLERHNEVMRLRKLCSRDHVFQPVVVLPVGDISLDGRGKQRRVLSNPGNLTDGRSEREAGTSADLTPVDATISCSG